MIFWRNKCKKEGRGKSEKRKGMKNANGESYRPKGQTVNFLGEGGWVSDQICTSTTYL